MLIDSGYGNNTSFLVELDNKKLNYIVGVAKNRKVTIEAESNLTEEIRLDVLAVSLPTQAFSSI